MHGKIIKGIAGFYYVYAEDGVTYACRARGIFRKDGQKPLVGDDVEITVTDTKDLEGSVDKILPRHSMLIRPAVANVDQALIIFASRDPEPNFLTLDRFLVLMEKQSIPAVICFNKTDLVPEDEENKYREIYRAAGYTVLCSSITENRGIEEIKSILTGKTTVVAGPSGVGKSSLTNLLQEDIRMETGDISRKLKRGKQTTRHAQVVPVERGTFLVDTPGFTSLYLTDMDEKDLKDYFPEFRQYEGNCRFLGCRHIHEPDCRVKEAVQKGLISEQRYADYLSLHQELSEQRRY